MLLNDLSNNDKTKKAGITAKTFPPNFLSPAFVPQFFYPKFLFTPPRFSKRAEKVMRVGLKKVTWNKGWERGCSTGEVKIWG